MATILVVDEHVWARQALCLALQRAGHDTGQAADLAEVRGLCRRTGAGWRPDITFVELVRQRGNGFSVAVWLQAHGHDNVILLSDRDDDADRLWARSRGIRHTWSRAQGADMLCRQVQKILADSCRLRPDVPGQEDNSGALP